MKYLRTSKRNDLPIDSAQKIEIIEYAEKLGFPKDAIYFYEDMNTSYGRMFGQERLHIGLDVLPPLLGMGKNANSRVSMKGAIAHEIVGHRAAELSGKVNPNILFEEVQASIRAARYAPDLNPTERFTLLRDAIERLRKEGISIKDVKHKLWIEADTITLKLRGMHE